LEGKLQVLKVNFNHDFIIIIITKNYHDIFGNVFVSQSLKQLVLFAVQQKFHIHCFFSMK